LIINKYSCFITFYYSVLINKTKLNVDEDYDIITTGNDDDFLVVVQGGGSTNFTSSTSDKDLLEHRKEHKEFDGTLNLAVF
jgi:hypothetical protein